MTAPACATGCGRPAPSAALCRACTGQLRGTLELAAAIADDLDDAVGRQLKHGTGGKSASTESPLPFDPVASGASGRLRWVLFRAISFVTPDAPAVQAASISWAAGHLAANVKLIARHPQAMEMRRQIRDAVDRCVTVLDAPAELHPAGYCQCGAPLLAEPLARTAACGRCGTVTAGITEARAQRAAQADVLGTATEISAVAATLGTVIPAGTIRSWASRGQLAQRPGEKYLLSEVLDLKAKSDARRAHA
jgi:hypothetical protein